MKIHIVGGGAIGLLHAGRLAFAGQEVIVWTRTERQAEQLRTEGIRLEDLGGETRDVSVLSYSLASLQMKQSADDDSPSWIILTVKQTHIDVPLLLQLQRLCAKHTALLCLQNGIVRTTQTTQNFFAALRPF